MLGVQSLESRAVIGKVLIAWRLGLLHPYLPDRSRPASGVISGGTARLAALFSYFYYKGGCQVFIWNYEVTGRRLVGVNSRCRLPWNPRSRTARDLGHPAVYQLAEGRIGTIRQATSQTINGGRTVPWIWSVIKFDNSGVATTTDHAIFPGLFCLQGWGEDCCAPADAEQYECVYREGRHLSETSVPNQISAGE
jgi:hypothetical protein